MSFVLTATTRGDDLFAPKTIVIATSDDRNILNACRDERATERETWLKTHPLPWWTESAIVSHEEIIEVPSL